MWYTTLFFKCAPAVKTILNVSKKKIDFNRIFDFLNSQFQSLRLTLQPNKFFTS